MTVEPIRGLVGRLRRAAAVQAADGLTDGALLDRFLRQSDHAAFADLVRRHGPMVLGVCRRVLANSQDVEDAFQAVFLVLVRKASSIVPRDMVGNWLHGVAYRTAVRVRSRNLLRKHREKQMGTIREPAAAEQGWDDLRPLLDEELGRLPARYRTVLVLCDMEGRTRKDAARHLKCPEGTVSTWLMRGRSLLAQRLTRRGVALGGGALAALLSERATACVPPTLVDSTLQCASAALAGTAAKGASVFAASQTIRGIPKGVAVIANGMARAMAINKSVVFAGWAVAAILGSATFGVVACYLQAGQDSRGPGIVESKTPQAEGPATAENLVHQLGDKNFAEREAAEKALAAMGAKAYPAVKAGRKRGDAEIVKRCERLLPDLRVAGLSAPDHPLWIRYQKVVGKTDDDRKLFLEAVSDKRRAEYFEAVNDNPDVAGAVYQRELDGALRHLSEKYEEAREKYKYSTGLTHPSVGTPDHAGMAALLFLGTFPASAKTTPKFEHPRLHGHYFNLMTMPKDSTVWAAEKRLYAAWLIARREPEAQRIGLQRAAYFEIAEAIPMARTIAVDEKRDVGDRVIALFVVAQSGNEADAALCEPLFKSEVVYHTTNYSDAKGQYPVITQVRDVAVAMALILHGEEPIDYEYEFLVIYKARGSEMRKKTPFYGFRTDDARKAAHEKAMAFFAKAPKTPAPKPKKLGRAAERPAALRAELVRWDTVYRHASEEKFAELERTAAELLKKYPEPENQAHILFQVAHVAGQSGIDKHVERVRTYGRKVLEISQDPIERGWVYSYLGSAAEFDTTLKTFAERRRVAAEVLLDGYAEVLAQDLPATAPELPAVDKIGDIDGSDPNELGKARSRQLAQIEARRQAEFVRDLVHRRDTLANQLRWLYHPHPKIHGRNAEGPEELRGLAIKKLKDRVAVDALLARVTAAD